VRSDQVELEPYLVEAVKAEMLEEGLPKNSTQVTFEQLEAAAWVTAFQSLVTYATR
jgi:hypothetical protein